MLWSAPIHAQSVSANGSSIARSEKVEDRLDLIEPVALGT